MKRIRVDEVLHILPKLEELRPLVDRILAVSRPDESRRWAASGELGTLGSRIVPVDVVEEQLETVVKLVRDRTEHTYGGIVVALTALEGGKPEEAVEALLALGRREMENRRLEAAEAYAVAARKTALPLRDRSYATRALLAGARAARGLGRLDAAAERYRESFRLARGSEDLERAVTAAIGAGNVLVDGGLWIEAGVWYERALRLMEASGHDGPQWWHAYLNLSIVERMRGRLEESERWLEKADAAHALRGDDGGRGLLTNARGQLQVARGNPKAAESHFRRAAEHANDPDAGVAMRVNLGEALAIQGRLLEAAEEGRRAERDALTGSVIPRLPETYRLLGRVAGARGVDDGLVFFEKALEVIRDRNLSRFELAQTLEAYGEFELSRDREEQGAERLHGAAEIYEELGSEALAERVRGKMPASDDISVEDTIDV